MIALPILFWQHYQLIVTLPLSVPAIALAHRCAYGYYYRLHTNQSGLDRSSSCLVLTILTMMALLSWQFTPFVLFTQQTALLVTYAFGFLTKPQLLAVTSSLVTLPVQRRSLLTSLPRGGV